MDTAIVGAFRDDDAGFDSGSAYVYDPIPDPLEMVTDLSQAIIDLNLPNGIENGLDAKLDAASRALQDVNENNDIAAIRALEAFIQAVEAQRGTKISDADADALVAATNQIIAVLSGA